MDILSPKARGAERALGEGQIPSPQSADRLAHSMDEAHKERNLLDQSDYPPISEGEKNGPKVADGLGPRFNGMKTKRSHYDRTALTGAAFSLIEVIVAIAIIGLVIGTFYTGLTHGFNVLRMEYEDRRATQILVQKAETIRLYSWEQVNSNGFIPSTFTVAYDPQSARSGVTYTGTISIADAPLDAPYSTGELKQVTVRLNWTTGQLARERELKTFVTRYGLQTYVD